MPLSSGSTYGRIKDYLIKSAEAATADPTDPDVDLNMTAEEIAGASWGSHSFRRNADRRARLYCERRGIPIERVDASFGWKEAEHSREMHLHYDESTLSRRWEEAQMTWDM